LPSSRSISLLEALLPLAHRRHEDRAHADGLAVGQRAVEFLQRLAGPEDLLEPVQRATHAGIGDQFVDDDRPGPDRGQKQADHN
jgi:hypothetical protein